MKLVEHFFAVLRSLIVGVFSLLQAILGTPSDKHLYSDTPMKWIDKMKLFSRYGRGLILNGKNRRLSVKNSKVHVAIFGRSGIGKSSVFYQVNLLSANGKTYVVTDVDGSLMEQSSGYLKSIGYDIFQINYKDIAQSDLFNSLSFCHTEDDLRSLSVLTITSGTTHNNAKDKFWEHSSINLLFLLLKLVKKMPEIYQNFANVKHLLTIIELDEFDEILVKYADDKLFREFVAYKATEDKLRSNIQASLDATLSLMSYSDVAYITSKTTIDIERLKRPNAILYVVIPERLLRQYSLSLSILYGTLFSELQKDKSKHPIYFLLDEAGVYKIDQLEVLISILRRYNCSLSLAAQNFEQWTQLYGPQAAKTIYTNCSTKIIFPGASLSMSEEISRSSGKKVVETSINGNVTHQVRPVITPSEIIQMKKNEILVQHSNYPFTKMRTYPFYKQRKLRRRSQMKPYLPEPKNVVPPPLISLDNHNPLIPPTDEQE